MADNVEVFRIVLDYQTAYEELERVKEKLKAAQSETRNLTIKQQELNEQFKQGVISEQEYQSASEALRQKLIANRKEVTALTEERKKAMQIEKSMALAEMAEANSLIQLRETVKSLTKQFDALGDAKYTSIKGQKMQKHIDELNAKLRELEMSTGRFGRNVGNYASGFNPLNFQVQQLTRELPSLTVNLQQFFLAISNNLPMFADELQRAKRANEELNKAGHATIPVWKQLLKSIGSWQTMLVVGITLLTAYGKEIGQWVKELFTGKRALADLTSASETMASSFAKDITNLGTLFNRLHDAKEGTEAYKRAKNDIISQYGKYLEGQREEIRTLQDQEAAYRLLTAAVIENARQKGLSEANEKATEEFTKSFNKAIEGVKSIFETKLGRDEGSKLFSSFIEGLMDSRGVLTDELKTIYFRFNELKTYTAGTQTRAYTINPLQSTVEQIKNAFDQSNETMRTAELIWGKLDKKTKSLIRDQEVLLAEAKLMPESTEAEIKAKNAKIKKIEDEISRLKNLGVVTKQQLSETEKAEKEAAKAKKQFEDDTIKYMREGREKDLADQKLKYQRAREEYKGNSEKLQEIEEWNHNQTLAINKKWDEKELDELDKQLKAQIDLMEDGTDKKIALLKLEREKLVRQAIMNGAGVIEAMEQANKWYKAKEKEIKDATPAGKRAIADRQAQNDFDFEIARIATLQIAQEKKDKLTFDAQIKLRKATEENHKKEIDELLALGLITKEVYDEIAAMIAQKMGAIDNDSANAEDPKNPKLKKVGRFFSNLFGYDPDDKDERKEFKQKRKELIDQAADTAREIGQAVIDIQTQISQRRLKLEQERIDAERDSELKSLELRYNKGLMSEKAYNKAVEATNAEADRKKEEAEREAFEREKRLKIMGIAIDTAAGITKVWSEAGLTGWKLAMAVAQTAFLTANGIAQTAVISNQQFAKGGIVPIGNGKNGVSMGLLKGPSHSQGGIPLMVNGQPVNAEVEGGEILAVINKRSAAQYLPLFSAINATNGVKFENGGVIGSGWSLPTPAPLPPSNGQMLAFMRDDLRTYYRQTERMIKATTERIDNIKVHVVEKDITKTQKKVASIRAKATIIGGK